MGKNLYIATMEPRSGKSVVLLGLMELLSRRIQKIGIFRPIVTAGEKRDDYIDLVCKRYKLEFDYEELYGVTHQEARDKLSRGEHEDLSKTMVDKYKALERQCDFVVCVGTDFTGVATAFELDFNHCGCGTGVLRGLYRARLHGDGHHGQPCDGGKPGRRGRASQ